MTSNTAYQSHSDIGERLSILKVNKSFDEIIKDMMNHNFGETIISRKYEIISDYERDSQGYLILNTDNSSGNLRVELEKNIFTNNVVDLTTGTTNYIFNPIFTEFAQTVATNVTNQTTDELKTQLDTTQIELISAQQQIQQLLQNLNTAIINNENLKENSVISLENMSKQYALLQQQYNIALAEKTRLQNLINSQGIPIEQLSQEFLQNSMMTSQSSTLNQA